jgi:hypothetical protein
MARAQGIAVPTFKPDRVSERRGELRRVGATIRECLKFTSSL